MFSRMHAQVRRDRIRSLGWAAVLLGSALPTAHAISSRNDPANHLLPPGSGLEAVARLSIGAGSCSGSLLATGRHVLTSAHCVAGAGLEPLVSQITMTFNDTAGTQASVTGLDKIHLNPSWNGDLSSGNDLAILTLDHAVAGIRGLELADTDDVLGRVVDIYGYGDFGVGAQGAVNPSDGQLRRVRNRYEALGSDAGMQRLGYVLDNLVFYDYDSGQSRYDSFGRYLKLSDTGLPDDEGSIGLGDSGGPSLLNGRIVGVHSFVLQLNGYVLNPSVVGTWGEIGSDALVHPAQDWIHAVAHAPEPSTWMLMGLGVGVAAVATRRRRG